MGGPPSVRTTGSAERHLRCSAHSIFEGSRSRFDFDWRSDLRSDGGIEIDIDLRCMDADDQCIAHSSVVPLQRGAALPPTECRIDSDESTARKIGSCTTPDVRMERSLVASLRSYKPIGIVTTSRLVVLSPPSCIDPTPKLAKRFCGSLDIES